MAKVSSATDERTSSVCQLAADARWPVEQAETLAERRAVGVTASSWTSVALVAGWSIEWTSLSGTTLLARTLCLAAVISDEQIA
jgi:hypothetical protein